MKQLFNFEGSIVLFLVHMHASGNRYHGVYELEQPRDIILIWLTQTNKQIYSIDTVNTN